MLHRRLVTGALVIFAVLAFCGAGPGDASPFNLFGFLFLLLAVVVWRNWGVIAGDFSHSLFDGLNAWNGGRYYRAADDRYRQDGPQHYREER